MMASGVRKSKHALPCAQHPAPMTISSTEGRYGITEPSEHYHILLHCLQAIRVSDRDSRTAIGRTRHLTSPI